MAESVCPVWVGYFLASPFRKLFQSPEKILSPYINKGMKVLDVGCAMGFFSLPLAQMVGEDGKFICIDIQPKMITSLQKRAHKSGLLNRIETRICKANSLCLDDLKKETDFTLVSAVVHEVPDASSFFSDICKAMKSAGRLLVIEPKGRVSNEDFKATVSIAQKNGFKVINGPKICRSHVALLKKYQEII